MWLVDTSVWIDHFRSGSSDLAEKLSEGSALIHPYVFGELACGNLRERATILADLGNIPEAVLAADSEVLHLVERKRLWGRGIGWIDAHLLTSALLTRSRLWTLDKRLARAVKELGLG